MGVDKSSNLKFQIANKYQNTNFKFQSDCYAPYGVILQKNHKKSLKNNLLFLDGTVNFYELNGCKKC